MNNRHRGSNWRAKVRKELQAKGQDDCGICKKPLKGTPRGSVHIDHKKPLSKGGTDDVGNLHLVHGRCNDIKGDGSNSIPVNQSNEIISALEVFSGIPIIGTPGVLIDNIQED